MHVIGLVIMSGYQRNVVNIVCYAQDIVTGSAIAILEPTFFDAAQYNPLSICDVLKNCEETRINLFRSSAYIIEYYTCLQLSLNSTLKTLHQRLEPALPNDWIAHVSASPIISQDMTAQRVPRCPSRIDEPLFTLLIRLFIQLEVHVLLQNQTSKCCVAAVCQ